ncbi:lasso RiPP family leader peptide-containing protein [Streptomyces sp. NRRL S-350]|nr:lasso RiPP family leader peptide-containing protein [Streptomyces sp. NRRL S-350]
MDIEIEGTETGTAYVAPAVDDLGDVTEVTLGSGGFNNPDSTMYWQG